MKALILRNDPEPTVAAMQMLLKRGFHVACVESQKMAHALIRMDDVDLLILDERIDGKFTHALALSAERRNPFVSTIMATDRPGVETDELFDLIPSLYGLVGHDMQAEVLGRLAFASIEDGTHVAFRVQRNRAIDEAEEALGYFPPTEMVEDELDAADASVIADAEVIADENAVEEAPVDAPELPHDAETAFDHSAIDLPTEVDVDLINLAEDDLPEASIHSQLDAADEADNMQIAAVSDVEETEAPDVDEVTVPEPAATEQPQAEHDASEVAIDAQTDMLSEDTVAEEPLQVGGQSDPLCADEAVQQDDQPDTFVFDAEIEATSEDDVVKVAAAEDQPADDFDKSLIGQENQISIGSLSAALDVELIQDVTSLWKKDRRVSAGEEAAPLVPDIPSYEDAVLATPELAEPQDAQPAPRDLGQVHTRETFEAEEDASMAS